MKKFSIHTAHSLADPEAPETELRIHFTFTPGYPEQGPSYASGGEPATSHEIEFASVEREADGKWIAAPEFADFAVGYLAGEGFDAAVEEAADDGPDPDDARDRDNDGRMTGAGRYSPEEGRDEH
jgi:hypothetical protein